MTRLQKLGAAVLLLLATAVASAGGSFTVEFEPLTLNLEFLYERQVAEVEGWRVYAGTGFAAEPWTVTRFDPYTLWCRDLDVLVAYSELCAEVRAPIVLDGGEAWLRIFWTTVW